MGNITIPFVWCPSQSVPTLSEEKVRINICKDLFIPKKILIVRAATEIVLVS
jgi:hypothetical protein